MLEIPAFTLGFLSLLVYLIGERLRDFDTPPSPAVVLGLRWLLVASGGLFGCALQTKFTTVLMLPPILADMVMTGCRIRISGLREKDLPRLGFKTLVQRISYWSAGLTIGVVVIMIANPEETFGPLFEVHFSDAISGITKADSRLNLSIHSLFKDYPFIIFSLLGCVVGVYKRNGRVFVPITMLMTAMLLHLWHTPFWRYYYLHIGLPAAWLMGYFVSETCQLVLLDGPVRMNLRYSGRLLGCCLTIFTCFSLLLFAIPDSAAISWLGSTPVDRGLVRSLAACSERGEWIYCRRAIYVFYSDLNSPPELAIVPLKRLWSGELTKPKICELLKHYEVDHIVLFSHEKEEYMDVILRLGYILEYQGIGAHYRLLHKIRN